MNDVIVIFKLVLGRGSTSSVYASKGGPAHEKKEFGEKLEGEVAELSRAEELIVKGDLTEHLSRDTHFCKHRK